MSATSRRIILIRHGQIEQVSPRRFVGQRDLPLDATGREQAARLAPVLDELLDGCTGAPLLVTSDLGRCRETASLALPGREVIPDSRLREILLGAWQGLSKDEVRERFPGGLDARGADMAGYRPAGGESFADVDVRVGPVLWKTLERLAPGGVAVLVAHGGVNRVLLAGLLGLPLAHLFRLGQDYACLNELRFEDNGLERVELVRLNDTSHLR